MAKSPLDKTDGPVGVTIKLNGKAMSDTAQAVSVRVFHALNRIPEAVFTLVTDSAQLEDFVELDSKDYALGTAVEIAAFYGTYSEMTLFKGIILSTRLRGDGREGVQMKVTCRDKALKMTDIRSSVSYLQRKDSEVMSAIIKEAGLKGDITATQAIAPLNLRVGATDWDFLRVLADRNGYVLRVDDGTITASEIDTSTPPVLSLTFGDDIVSMDFDVDAHRMIAESSASAWNAQTQKKLTGKDSNLPTNSQGNTKISAFAKALDSRSLDANTARDLPEADLKGFAKARVARAGLDTVHGSVTFQGSGNVKLADMIEINGVGKRFGGKAYVTGLDHTIEEGVWSTKARMGLPQDWTSDSFGLAAAGAEALTAPIHGTQIGKVMSVAEDPDGGQRIQVSLPMIGDPPAEVWARHATPYASNAAGIQFLPEVDDEVVVSFLNADPNAPVVIGALHNDVAKRPEAEAEENNIKTIVTRSKLKLTFDDDKKIIIVETPGGHMLTMDDDATTLSMVDSNGNSLVMDSSGIKMESMADITMTAIGNITAEATGDATINGVNVTCEGQAGFTGKGGASAELSAGGTTTVKGAMVQIN
ncbi:MAG: type VI secretion system tip protein VgrG [Roseobacter sp.]